MNKFSYDKAIERGTSFHGWGLDRLLRELLEGAAEQQCEQCGVCGDCIHNAARTVLGLMRIVEHDPNCPDCAAIRAEESSGPTVPASEPDPQSP